MSDRTSARDQFGRNAEKYLSSQAHNRPDEIMAIIEQHGLKGNRVADVGTGAGHVAYALAQHCGHVYAYDLAPEMLAIVDREAPKRGLDNVETVLGTAEEMPFEDASLDGVATRTAAHHFMDADAFVGQVSRVLKPGGWFFVQDSYSPENDEDAQALDKIERLRDPSHIWNYKESEWRNFCEKHGLRVDSVELGSIDVDLNQWLERMQVPDETQKIVVALIHNAKPSLKKLINPLVKDGVEYFHIPKISLRATKPA